MKKILLFACAAALCVVTASGQRQAVDDLTANTTIVKEGTVAPEFTAQMLDGTTINSVENRGKVILVTFWATWCPPCRAEFKRVQADIVERYSGRDFVWVPLSRGETKADVEKFMEKSGHTFNVGLDPDKKIYDMFAENYIPRNFLIDKQGIVQLATVGYIPEEFDSMLVTIDSLLAE